VQYFPYAPSRLVIDAVRSGFDLPARTWTCTPGSVHPLAWMCTWTFGFGFTVFGSSGLGSWYWILTMSQWKIYSMSLPKLNLASISIHASFMPKWVILTSKIGSTCLPSLYHQPYRHLSWMSVECHMLRQSSCLADTDCWLDPLVSITHDSPSCYHTPPPLP